MNRETSILIVEDDEDLNKAYQMILASDGHTVHSVYDGKQALEHIAEHGDPDIMFLDLRMPVMDGIEFLEQYDAPSHEGTIVVFSNYDAQDEVDKAFRLGADRYVLKARAAPKELLRIVADITAEKAEVA